MFIGIHEIEPLNFDLKLVFKISIIVFLTILKIT
jgi:hypothetical protein